MIIYPIRWKSDEKGKKPILYSSDNVSTTINGKKETVTNFGYFGKTRAKVIKQAYGNALVKKWRAELAEKFRVK